MFKRLLLSTIVVALGSGAIAAHGDCRGVKFTNDAKRGMAFYRTPWVYYKGEPMYALDTIRPRHKITLTRTFRNEADITELTLVIFNSDDFTGEDVIKIRRVGHHNVYLSFEGLEYKNDSVEVRIELGTKEYSSRVECTLPVDARLKELLLTKKLTRAGTGGCEVAPSRKFTKRLAGWTRCITDKKPPDEQHNFSQRT